MMTKQVFSYRDKFIYDDKHTYTHIHNYRDKYIYIDKHTDNYIHSCKHSITLNTYIDKSASDLEKS